MRGRGFDVQHEGIGGPLYRGDDYMLPDHPGYRADRDREPWRPQHDQSSSLIEESGGVRDMHFRNADEEFGFRGPPQDDYFTEGI